MSSPTSQRRRPQTQAEFDQWSAEMLEAARQRVRDGAVNIRRKPHDPAIPLRRNPTRPRRILIANTAWNVITGELFTQRSTGYETGGALTGRITDTAIIVTAATVYEDELTERGPGQLTSSLLELSETPGLIGDWHSHAYQPDATQSPGDLASAASVLKDLDLAEYVTLVVSTAGDYAAQTQRYEHTGWLWQRDHAGLVTYETLAG